ncbi:hypothetical protein QTS76_35095 [Micromonospora sp. b486]|nr:hypothetical protein [Micromonospora sp. b486]MDM4784395.1 hypothetical protein [Micromonospora sp. b486]
MADSGLGTRFAQASSLTEAAATTSTPDCVLLDLHLPDSRGLAALRQVLHRWPDAAVVVLTGLADAATAAEPPAYDPWSAMPPAVAPPTEQFPAAPQFAAPPVPPAQSAVAVQIAEIMVTPPVIRTPAGVLPLAGASWYVTDCWQKEEKIAPWAVVAAILGFFCLTVFSLLFLLIKETRHYGTVQVTVSSGGHQYVARIPVTDQFQVQQLNNQVNYARSLSAG